jgi:hypothetical protein
MSDIKTTLLHAHTFEWEAKEYPKKTICDRYESQITKFLLQFNIRKIAVAIIRNIKKIRETLQSYLIHSPIDAHNTYELAMTNMEVTPAESGTSGMLARYIYVEIRTSGIHIR